MAPGSSSANPEITPLLERVRAGDVSARAELWSRVEDQIQAIATRKLRTEAQSLETTTLVHEIYLRLFGKGAPAFENRAHFFGAVARAMQQVLIREAHARKKRPRPVDPAALLEILSDSGTRIEEPEEFEALNAAIDRLGEDERNARKAEILRLRYFAELLPGEIARVLSISPDTVQRDLRLGRAWIYREIKRGRRQR